MRIFVIKNKGANIWQNFVTEKQLTFKDEVKILTGYFFFRKKDAEKYLKTFKYNKFFDVVGCSVDKSKGDNRKKNVIF